MSNVFIINGHQKYSFSEGKLNASFVERAESFFTGKGFSVKTSLAAEPYNVDAEIEKFKWSNVVLLQAPINWLGTPWSFKKYVDDIWTAGMGGALSDGDGRTGADPKKNYGLGGQLKGQYLLSVTGNVPREAFENPEEKFFDGVSVDDLLLPVHLSFKWLGLTPLPTFTAYDVVKNPEIESDFRRFDEHLASAFKS